MTAPRPRWKSVLLHARALAFGVIVAVLLVTAYAWVEESRSAGNMITPLQFARVAAAFSLVVALELLVVCVPLWLVLDRLGWANWISAALLGFAGPLGWWMIVLESGDDTLFERAEYGLPYALCGAVAGLVVWLTRPRAADADTAS
jgi:heme A synthase